MHKDVYGYGQYSDFKILFEKKCFWSNEIDTYIVHLTEICTAGCSPTHLRSSRKVSVCSLHLSINNFLAINLLYLEKICLFHAMDCEKCFFGCVHCEVDEATRSSRRN